MDQTLGQHVHRRPVTLQLAVLAAHAAVAAVPPTDVRQLDDGSGNTNWSSAARGGAFDSASRSSDEAREEGLTWFFGARPEFHFPRLPLAWSVLGCAWTLPPALLWCGAQLIRVWTGAMRPLP